MEKVAGAQLRVEEVAADLLQPGDFVMANISVAGSIRMIPYLGQVN